MEKNQRALMISPNLPGRLARLGTMSHRRVEWLKDDLKDAVRHTLTKVALDLGTPLLDETRHMRQTQPDSDVVVPEEILLAEKLFWTELHGLRSGEKTTSEFPELFIKGPGHMLNMSALLGDLNFLFVNCTDTSLVKDVLLGIASIYTGRWETFLAAREPQGRGARIRKAIPNQNRRTLEILAQYLPSLREVVQDKHLSVILGKIILLEFTSGIAGNDLKEIDAEATKRIRKILEVPTVNLQRIAAQQAEIARQQTDAEGRRKNAEEVIASDRIGHENQIEAAIQQRAALDARLIEIEAMFQSLRTEHQVQNLSYHGARAHARSIAASRGFYEDNSSKAARARTALTTVVMSLVTEMQTLAFKAQQKYTRAEFDGVVAQFIEPIRQLLNTVDRDLIIVGE